MTSLLCTDFNLQHLWVVKSHWKNHRKAIIKSFVLILLNKIYEMSLYESLCSFWINTTNIRQINTSVLFLCFTVKLSLLSLNIACPQNSLILNIISTFPNKSMHLYVTDIRIYCEADLTFFSLSLITISTYDIKEFQLKMIRCQTGSHVLFTPPWNKTTQI